MELVGKPYILNGRLIKNNAVPLTRKHIDLIKFAHGREAWLRSLSWIFRQCVE
jgi:hypothetical protein